MCVQDRSQWMHVYVCVVKYVIYVQYVWLRFSRQKCGMHKAPGSTDSFNADNDSGHKTLHLLFRHMSGSTNMINMCTELSCTVRGSRRWVWKSEEKKAENYLTFQQNLGHHAILFFSFLFCYFPSSTIHLCIICMVQNYISHDPMEGRHLRGMGWSAKKQLKTRLVRCKERN